jgi:hypothetical protein
MTSTFPKETHSFESSRATSFISLYLNVSGQEAIEDVLISKTFPRVPILPSLLTNRSDPILLDQADDPDADTAPLLDDTSLDAFRVLSGLLVNNVRE